MDEGQSLNDNGSETARTRSESGTGLKSDLGEFAERSSEKAKEAFSAAASKATERAEAFADQQIDWGADMIGHVAGSVRAAADNLAETAPQFGGLAEAVAGRIEDFSDSLRGRSARELSQAASDFARRNPAVLLGGAAALGFLLVRMMNAAPTPRTTFADSADSDEFGVARSTRPRSKNTSTRSGGTNGRGESGRSKRSSGTS